MVVNTWYSVSRILWKVDRACSIFNPDDVYHRYRSVTPLDAARVNCYRTIFHNHSVQCALAILTCIEGGNYSTQA